MNREQLSLIDGPQDILRKKHYLGELKRGTIYSDPAGVIVVAAPTGRRLPPSWLEVSRWCITDKSKNAGSKQWRRCVAWLRMRFPEATTIVSYSDPSVGHDGALYRACGWRWAPTWHRLRPPPTGNGTRSGKQQAVKDRWVFLLLPDPQRESVLRVQDESILRRMPWASYKEPSWRRGAPHDGGGDYKRFIRGRAP